LQKETSEELKCSTRNPVYLLRGPNHNPLEDLLCVMRKKSMTKIHWTPDENFEGN